MPFVSIIIPVYKVEKYLNQCIDSVLVQNLEDYELILVDDGSPDSCPRICDEYALKNDNIKVIHKHNGGSSSARNLGILASQGEYIMFMDSDDWWNEKVCVTEILQIVKSKRDVEMFLLTSLDYVEGQGTFKRNEHKNLDKISTESVENYYQDLLSNGNMEVHAATKIFKAEFLKSNQLYFKEGIKGEDNEWMIRVLRSLKKVEIINEPIYIYRAGREGSVSNTIGLSNVTDLLNIIELSIDYYASGQGNDRIKEKELCFCSYLWFVALGLSKKLSKEDKQKVKPLFEKTASVCSYSKSKKTKLCHTVYKIFGINITMMILGLYIARKSKKQTNKSKVDEK